MKIYKKVYGGFTEFAAKTYYLPTIQCISDPTSPTNNKYESLIITSIVKFNL